MERTESEGFKVENTNKDHFVMTKMDMTTYNLDKIG